MFENTKDIIMANGILTLLMKQIIDLQKLIQKITRLYFPY